MNLIKTTVKNFVRHGATDLAAGLTYYAVFAIFPAALALAALLSVVGEADSSLRTILDVLRPLMSDSTLNDIEPTLRDLTAVKGAPLVLGLGAGLSLYSASGYVGAFGRAMNVVREVEETRPFWKLRPYLLLITLVCVVLNAAALVIIVVTGPITTSVGEKLGLGTDVLDVWEIAKWPALAVMVVIVVALLFHATPNVKSGRLRLLTPGAFVALLLWAGLSTGFAFYVANFSEYNKTYGSIAGVIVALLWLWLTNVALLLGAELDAARDVRREARTAMVAAAPSPSVEHLETSATEAGQPGPASPVAVTSSRRRDKVRITESFPRKSGEAPYGPALQPVPEED